MARGQWTKWGGKTGNTPGYGLEIGEVYRASITLRLNNGGKPDHWEATLNLNKMGPFPDKDAAIRAVEFELEQGMRRLDEDWAVFRATRILAMKAGKKVI